MKRTGPIPQIVRFYRAIQCYRFATLLVSLFALFFAVAIVYLFRAPSQRPFAGLSVALLFDVMLLSAVNAVCRSQRTMMVLVSVAVPAALFSLIAATFPVPPIRVINDLLAIAFITLVIIFMLDFLFHTKQVDANMICASLCVYLLIGIAWSSLYSLCEVILPGSFIYAYAGEGEQAGMVFGDEIPIYYSFVTLTTLGYGDMVPVSPPARILAVLEATVGQIYLTVLVARLVGLHIAHVTTRSSGEA